MTVLLLLSGLIFTLLVFLLSSVGFVRSFSEEPNLSPEELLALENFYDTTNGQHWRWHGLDGRWNFSGEPSPCAGWQGITCTLPRNSSAYVYIFNLTLEYYNLEGPIPESVMTFRNMSVLDLFNNSLTGPILSFSGESMPHLTTLNLSENLLTGTIPHSLGSLTRLSHFDLSGSGIVGEIPSTFINLTEMVFLEIYITSMTGTIPQYLCEFPNLENVYLQASRFEGTIPSCFASSSVLILLSLDGNYLTGTIPNFEGQSMNQLTLGANHLSGSIPDCIADLPQLERLVLGGNQLHGNLLQKTFVSKKLRYLDLTGCSQFGPFPILTDQPFLTLLDIRKNELTGSIPPNTWDMKNLTYFLVTDNYLTGTLPVVSNIDQVILMLGTNYLTGTIPEGYGDLVNLKVLEVGENRLHGAAPENFGKLTNLSTLDVSSNRLSGCIPDLRHLTSLKIVRLNSNNCGCNLDQLTSAEQKSLIEIDISHNQFTGTLPKYFFEHSQLNTFVAGGNCLTGTLPRSFCSLGRLTTLILDGLHTSPHCRTLIWALSNAYTIVDGFKGTIPSCFFRLPSLETLHLSGNSLTGTLPNVTVTPSLTEITFSDNDLRGLIPLTIQFHNWTYIDLSYNRLSGKLHPEFGKAMSPSGYVHLKNNRLSGDIPQLLQPIQNVSILGTNLFYCALSKRQIPQHDRDKNGYDCGSTGFEGTYYILIVIVGLIAVYACWMRWSPITFDWMHQTGVYLEKWRVPKGSLPQSCQHVYTMVGILCQVGVYCTIPIVIVLLPWYTAASHYWGTYSNTYAWTVSAAFIAGFTPGMVEYVPFTLLIAVLVALVAAVTMRTEKDEQVFAERSSLRTVSIAQRSIIPMHRRVFTYSSYLLFNCVIVGLANAGLVFANESDSAALTYLAGFLLSLFKFFWNSLIVPRLVDLASTSTGQRDKSAGFFTVQVFLGLFNNIAIPCMVVAVLSDNCFRGAFRDPYTVKSHYLDFHCLPITPINILEPLCSTFSVASEYEAPFNYTYQCSSCFITSYAATFTFLAITAGVASPLFSAVMINILPATLMEDHAQNSSNTKSSSTEKTDSIAVNYEQDASTFTASSSTLTSSPSPATVTMGTQPSFLYRTAMFISPRILRPISAASASIATNPQQMGPKSLEAFIFRRSPFLDANNLLVSLIIYLGILLTFGAVFPPLAAAMGFTMLSVAWHAKLKMGRLLFHAKEAGFDHVRDIVERECKDSASFAKLRGGLLMILIFGYCFYSVFVFDTIGVADGFYRAYWALIVMPLTIAAFYMTIRAFRFQQERKTGTVQRSYSLDGRSVEMVQSTLKRELSAAAALEAKQHRHTECSEQDYDESKSTTFNALTRNMTHAV